MYKFVFLYVFKVVNKKNIFRREYDKKIIKNDPCDSPTTDIPKRQNRPPNPLKSTPTLSHSIPRP